MTEAQLEAHVAKIATDGYTIVENAIEPELVDALADDLLRLERELGAVPAQNIFEGTRTTRIYNLLARGHLYQRIPVHASVLPIVEKVLDRGCLVSSLSSIAIGRSPTSPRTTVPRASFPAVISATMHRRSASTTSRSPR